MVKKLKENSQNSFDRDVSIGLYGGESSLVGYNRDFEKFLQYVKSKGIRAVDADVYDDGEWEVTLVGNPRKIFFAVVDKISGYNCDSVEEFVDRWEV